MLHRDWLFRPPSRYRPPNTMLRRCLRCFFFYFNTRGFNRRHDLEKDGICVLKFFGVAIIDPLLVRPLSCFILCTDRVSPGSTYLLELFQGAKPKNYSDITFSARVNSNLAILLDPSCIDRAIMQLHRLRGDMPLWRKWLKYDVAKCIVI